MYLAVQFSKTSYLIVMYPYIRMLHLRC